MSLFTLLARLGKWRMYWKANGVKLYKPYFLDTLDKLPVYIRKPLIMVLSSVSYLRVLSKYNPDILHFFLPQAYLFGAILSFLSRKRIRLMSRRSLNFYQKKHKGLTRIEHALHLKMDAVLGNSISVNEQLIEEGVPQDKLGLIYNGVNLNQFKNLPPRSKVRSEIGVGHDDLMMVCVANLIQYKGHADLLQALHTIKHDLPNGWRLILVGRFTEYAAVLQAMVSEVGLTENVIFFLRRAH
ncbi:glycosyltransferase [Chromobacterium haemolyticum]|nr:glycosyltransferase [Chromobacterium haemolyticum]